MGITVNNQLKFSIKDAGRFPEIKELKKVVMNKISPGRILGHR